MTEEKETPVKVDDIIDVKIEKLGTKNDGIAKIEGYVIIVTQPITVGKTYKVKITEVRPTMSFAEVVDNKK